VADPIRLSPEGPHSDDDTKQVAEHLAECMRVLCYATRPGADGVTSPVTVYDVLGEMQTTAFRMDQLLRQLAQLLAAQQATGRLRDVGGYDPGIAAAEATLALTTARGAAAGLAAALGRAHHLTSGLHLQECGEE
jgi:hypothetical protein